MKTSRALLFLCIAGLTGNAWSGSIAITPAAATAPTTGGGTTPTPHAVEYTAAAAGETTNNFSANVLFDNTKFTVAIVSDPNSACTANATNIRVVTQNNGAGNLASGTICTFAFTSLAGTVAGPSPLTLEFNAGLGDGCLDNTGVPTATPCTLTNASINVTAGTFNYAATPATLTYNGVVGSPTATQNVNIAAQAGNTGDVTFSACSFAGANAGDFAMSPAPTFPLNVAANTNVNIPIAFTAGALGARTATFSCTTANGTAVGGSFPITLNGTGVTNTLTTDATITFPATLVGSPAPGENVVATAGAGNTGNVTITSCAITGANAGDFSQLPAVANLVVAPGASVNVPVGFTPTAVGARTADLTCNLTNGPAATFVTTLNGTGTPAAPVFTPNPANNTAINALGSAGTPLQRFVNFANSGNASGTVTCTVTGAGFTVGGSPLVVAANTNGSIFVTGNSGVPTTLTGTLDCTDSIGGVYSYPLSFTFGAPAVAQIPTLSGFGLFALLGLFAGVGMFFVFRNRA